ncbi:MAG: antibiotic biosynthesis monooxygenase [Oscillospiraceae bacterium]|jgi:quinol monooxygenase YgiN|nr:antibiotic biosynthesis monooxygenase [Oscillospiraceae bacterium]
MVRVIAKNYLKSEKIAEAAPLFREMIEATRKENGCIEYRLHIDTKDPTCYVFVEEWADQNALDAHCKSAHFTRIIPQIGTFHAKPGETLIMDEFK